MSFELDLFDKADWHPIDDGIVTELHDKLQLLPCAFPHAEYLRENYVKYPVIKDMKSAKAIGKPLKFTRICPGNDSHLISEKRGNIESKRKNSQRLSRLAKNKKKARARARKAAEKKAIEIETEEFKATKKLLADTMDHFNTLDGHSLNVTTSIAARTRNRSKIPHLESNFVSTKKA